MIYTQSHTIYTQSHKQTLKYSHKNSQSHTKFTASCLHPPTAADQRRTRHNLPLSHPTTDDDKRQLHSAHPQPNKRNSHDSQTVKHTRSSRSKLDPATRCSNHRESTPTKAAPRVSDLPICCHQVPDLLRHLHASNHPPSPDLIKAPFDPASSIRFKCHLAIDF